MPETPKKDHGPSLPDRLVSDPKNPPELTLLQGWLGASSEDRCRRLYLDPALAQSIEIPEDAIVHTLEIPATTSPLGGHWVWVKADAAIDPNALLPAERGYYRYTGSLTTPPCSEIVEWLVLATPISVAEADIASFAKLYPMNARPAQKDNRRYVLQSM